MIKLENRAIYVTESDKRRLEVILDYVEDAHKMDLCYAEMLQRELERAVVVTAQKVPPDVITMNSQVRVKDLDTGRVVVYTLVFPRDADFSKNRISVLAPIGTALLGRRVGDSVAWKVPAGTKRLKVEAILYQPEQAGQEPEAARVCDPFALYEARI